MKSDPVGSETTKRPDDNWQSWCWLTLSACTAKIPAACLCAQMAPDQIFKMKERAVRG